MRFLLFFIATLAIAGQFTTSLVSSQANTPSAIATDSAGNSYIVGSLLPVNSGASFLTKLDPNGKVLFTNTFSSTNVAAVTLDPSGNIYIAGSTNSPVFALSHALQAQPGVGGTGFVAKISNDGSTTLYSTYFGGKLGASYISALATDASGNLYVTGNTSSPDFPQTSGLPLVQFTSSDGALASGTIVTEISAAGDKILYSGLILTGPYDNVAGHTSIAVDAAGNAYVVGNSADPNLPVTTSAPARTNGGAFVAKVNATGAGFGYLNYLPGSTSVSSVAVDAAGDAIVAGYSSNFPTTPSSVQPNLLAGGAIASDGYIAKLNPSGSGFLWSTYMPGGCGAWPYSLAVDPAGNVWASGYIQNASCPIPNTNGWSNGGEFLMAVNATGSQQVYAALYPLGSIAASLAVDSSGLVHAAGSSAFVSTIAPTGPPSGNIFAFENAFGASFTAQISPAEVIAIYGPGIGPATGVSATPVNGVYPTTLGGVEVAINGANIPILYASSNQINAVVPMELASNTTAAVHVTNGKTTSLDYPVSIMTSSPIAFPQVLNQDGTINSQSNPAHGGSIVTFYVTGWQSSFTPLSDGQNATVAQDACDGACQASAKAYNYVTQCLGFCFAKPAINVIASITASVLYGGAAPGMVAGVSQFNVQLGTLPAGSGTNQFVLSVTGGPANTSFSQEVWIAP
jgi:uncharacterized protein (TIGR03437 family)